MLGYYGTSGLPARVKHPKDKAKVEVGVQVVERWILARLRHQKFFSLSELNSAIRRLLEELNHRPFRKLPGSRHSLYESLDRPALRSLPTERYVYAEWIPERVLDWTTSAGPFTRKVAECILASRLHPQQAFRSCLGLMRLGKIYGPERLEAASRKALYYQAVSYRSINSILKNRLDEKPLGEESPVSKPISHPNIRGSSYYEGESSC
jgi:transposase